MKKLLFVDCLIRGRESRTKILADLFLENVSDEYEITHLNLMEENLQPLYGQFFEDRQKLLEAGELNHPRFRYAHQLAQADVVLIAAPYWDLSFPALVKIYIENCSVDGITFYADEKGLHGLCKGKLLFLTTRGGSYDNDSLWAQDIAYLSAIKEFFGFTSFEYVTADGMDIDEPTRLQSLEEAKQKVTELARSLA